MKPETENNTQEASSTAPAGYANGGAELTMRDEIAIRILPYCAEADDGGTVKDAAKELGIEPEKYSCREHWPILAAKRAYEYADALIAVRSGRHSHTHRL